MMTAERLPRVPVLARRDRAGVISIGAVRAAPVTEEWATIASRHHVMFDLR
jgi:hypothetical protein